MRKLHNAARSVMFYGDMRPSALYPHERTQKKDLATIGVHAISLCLRTPHLQVQRYSARQKDGEMEGTAAAGNGVRWCFHCRRVVLAFPQKNRQRTQGDRLMNILMSCWLAAGCNVSGTNALRSALPRRKCLTACLPCPFLATLHTHTHSSTRSSKMYVWFTYNAIVCVVYGKYFHIYCAHIYEDIQNTHESPKKKQPRLPR